MLIHSKACDPRVHEAAIGMARRCRFIIQACLREEEWRDADFEFYMIIREGVERLVADTRDQPGGATESQGRIDAQ